MLMKNITNDTHNVLCILYKTYLEKRKSGNSKLQAMDFSSYEHFRKEHIPELHPDDMHIAIIELKNNGYVKMFVDGGFQLTDQAIVLMENEFKNNLSNVIDFVNNLPILRKIL